jgi:PTS system nitrogen regulatory IIA component
MSLYTLVPLRPVPVPVPDIVPDLLNPKQLAEYLQLSSRTVYRLLERGEIPAARVGGQWRFRKAAVDEWLDLNMQRLDADTLDPIEDETGQLPRLIADLLVPENAHLVIPAGSRESVVRDMIARVQFPEPVNRTLVAERLLERERMCSTALNDGVALLHTPRRRPRVLAAHDLAAIARIETPIDFGALDGSMTDTLILLLARSERDQLALLAKLGRLCREATFLAALHQAGTGEEVIALISRVESQLFAAPL